MAVKPKPEEPPPSKAYLVSFGDTMTALLAFFIVLLSLAQDQTGLNSHAGTGSFVKAINGIGLPGAFSGDTSKQVLQKQAVSPLYLAEDPENGEPDNKASGPDQSNGERVIDREDESFQRFLNELDRLTKVKSLPETEGEVIFDIFNRFNREPPYLKEPHREALKRALPVLRQKNYRIELVVWATGPSKSAWTRAVDRSIHVYDEVTQWAHLSSDRKGRMIPFGKPWLYANVKRPIFSIVIRKLDAKT